MNIAVALATISETLWQTAIALLAAVTVLIGVGLWALILVGLHMTFKHWRLYSRHRLAVRIRRWLTARRQRAREARA